MDDINTRTAEILVDGEWVEINPIGIKKDMTFRMFESTGELITNKKNQSVWTAISDAYYDNGVIMVET